MLAHKKKEGAMQKHEKEKGEKSENHRKADSLHFYKDPEGQDGRAKGLAPGF